MIKLLLASVFVYVSSFSATFGDTSFVAGKAISESDDVHIVPLPSEVCPEDTICMQGWSRWTISVERHLSGPNVKKGRVYVVHIQHTTHNPESFKKLRFFALEYIADRKERLRLHADYKLLDLLDEQHMLCTFADPREMGVSIDNVYTGHMDGSNRFCFDEPIANISN